MLQNQTSKSRVQNNFALAGLLLVAALTWLPARVSVAEEVGGSSLAVPFPWKPLKLKGQRVDCFGREYDFAGSDLIGQIRSKQQQFLAEPVRFTIKSKNQAFPWQQTSFHLSRINDGLALATSETEVTGLPTLLKTKAWIEYDGFIKFECTFKNTACIQELVLEIPLRKDVGKYFHYFPEKWPRGFFPKYLSTGVARQGKDLAFKPIVWLGNDDVGLSWCCESPQGWEPGGPQPISIKVKGDATLLRITMKGAAGKPLPDPFSVTFGVQATPVKPFNKKDLQAQVASRAYWGVDKDVFDKVRGKNVTVLQEAENLGVEYLIFFHTWTSIMSYFDTKQAEALRALIQEMHQHNIKVILYYGYQISTLAPEWATMGDQVVNKPLQRYWTKPYYVKEGMPVQDAYTVCYRSKWRELALKKLPALFRRFDIDGLYLDTTLVPHGCINQAHGCGYRDEGGRLQPTYPVFEVRQFAKDLYEKIKSIRPHAFLMAHQSDCLFSPALGFVDAYLDGEQFAFSGIAQGPEAREKLSFAQMRAEFTGTPLGVPAQFLYHRGFDLQTGLDLALIHGVNPFPAAIAEKKEDFLKIAQIWQIFRQFSIEEAEWLPYWQTNRFIQSPIPAGIKISLYARPDSLLLLILNTNSNKININIHINDKLFMVKNATDKLNHKAISNQHNNIIINLTPWRLKIIHIT